MSSSKQAKKTKPAGKPTARRRTSAPRQDRLRSLIDLSTDFCWETDADHRFVWLEGRALDKTPQRVSRSRDKARWSIGGVPVGHGCTWDKHRATLDARQAFADCFYAHVDTRGGLRYFSLSGKPVFDARGRFRGHRGIALDVTQRIQTELRYEIEHGVTRILAAANDIGEAGPNIIRLICETLGWACGALWRLDAEGNSLRCGETWAAASPGVDEFLAAARQIVNVAEPGRGLVRATWAKGEPVWIRDVTQEVSFRRAGEATTAGLHSAFAFPIKIDAHTVGVMEFFSREIHEPDAELLQGTIFIASQIGQFLQRKQAEAQLRESEKRFQGTFELAAVGIAHVDAGGRFIHANRQLCEMLGYTRQELLGMTVKQVSHPDDANVADHLRTQLRSGHIPSFKIEKRYMRKDGSPIWAELTTAVQRGPAGELLHDIAVLEDISVRKRAEQATARLGRMFTAISATNEATLRAKSRAELYERVCDTAMRDGRFKLVSVLLPDSEASMKCVAASGAGGQALREVRISVDAATPIGRGLVGEAFRTQKPAVSNDFLNDDRTRPWHEDARKASVAAGAALPLVQGGRSTGVLLFFADEAGAFDEEIVKLLERMAENVSFALDGFEREEERKRADERVQYLATHDGLTDLPNRVMFSQLLSLAIQTARRYERSFAVLFIDLDRFKLINDTLGHAAGDTLLKVMASRLKECLRESDVVARLGGDEFVVLVQEVGHPSQIATVARKILSAAIKPVVVSGQECRVTASIGICMYPADAQDEQSLMKNADMAMYQAKEEGKNNYQFYSSDIKAQSLERLTLETNLRRALECNELSLHYQAKMDFKTGAIAGVEALLRWHNPELGTVSPTRFIPIAEETGMILPIGRWVLRTACAQNVAWQRQGLPSIRVAVNLSARQLADDDLLNDISSVLETTGMAPDLLELEITEGTVTQNPEQAVRVLTAIKRMGVRVAIDDFGTGYSSLGQLKTFPVDTLKVDRSFIRGVAQNVEDKAITEAIIAMAKTLSLTVVAEGVETRDQEAFLREHACDQMQGYYFSKPITPDQLAELLHSHQPQASTVRPAPASPAPADPAPAAMAVLLGVPR